MPSSLRHIERVRSAAAMRLRETVALATRICEVPAPTGSEIDRAALVADILRSRGYVPDIDAIGNVTVRRGGNSDKALMLLAHTDTVFPAGTTVRARSEGDRLHGPGIGDNSLGVAAMIESLALLDELGIDTSADILAVANVGEEGLGNLAGARAAIERHRADIDAVIAVEGHNLGRVTHGAVGSTRLRITISGRGGHSWGAFGEPSAIHVLAAIIVKITAVHVPATPKTTYNVGLIQGGVSVNTIAPTASAVVDLRSIDPQALAELEAQVRCIATTDVPEHVHAAIEVLGERPAGTCPRDASIVQSAAGILRSLGHDVVFDASSTDANIPISLGIPAVCIGITTGGLSHTIDEYIDVRPIVDGLTQLVMLCIDGANASSVSRNEY